MDQYRIPGNPDYALDNAGNPYEENQPHSQEGQPYTSNLVGKSTLVSDSVEMVKRLHAYLPWSSVKQGTPPSKWGEGSNREEENQGSDYKSKYTY